MTHRYGPTDPAFRAASCNAATSWARPCDTPYEADEWVLARVTAATALDARRGTAAAVRAAGVLSSPSTRFASSPVHRATTRLMSDALRRAGVST